MSMAINTGMGMKNSMYQSNNFANPENQNQQSFKANRDIRQPHSQINEKNRYPNQDNDTSYIGGSSGMNNENILHDVLPLVNENNKSLINLITNELTNIQLNLDKELYEILIERVKSII